MNALLPELNSPTTTSRNSSSSCAIDRAEVGEGRVVGAGAGKRGAEAVEQRALGGERLVLRAGQEGRAA